MLPLSDAQKAYVATLKAVRAETEFLRKEEERQDLWRSCHEEDWVGDALRAQEEVEAIRAARLAGLRVEMLRAELDV